MLYLKVVIVRPCVLVVAQFCFVQDEEVRPLYLPPVVIPQTHRLVSQERDCPRGREPLYLLTSFQSCYLVSGGSYFYSWCVTPHSSPTRGHQPLQIIFNILNNFTTIK